MRERVGPVFDRVADVLAQTVPKLRDPPGAIRGGPLLRTRCVCVCAGEMPSPPASPALMQLASCCTKTRVGHIEAFAEQGPRAAR